MVNTFKRICQSFGAGALGGLVSSLIFILFHRAGVMAAMSVAWQPCMFRTFHIVGHDGVLTGRLMVWLYEALALYGIFGLLFLLPWLKGSQAQRALVYSLIPSAFELLYAFPVHGGFELFGMKLGAFTFLFVLVFNFIWGFVTVSFVPGGK